MQSDLYRLLVVATATKIPGDKAFEMLSQDFIDEFVTQYNTSLACGYGCDVQESEKALVLPSLLEQPKLPMVDALIIFATNKLGISRDDSSSVNYSLSAKRAEIVNLFLTSNVSDLLYILASRQSMRNNIKQAIRSLNIYSSTYSNIESTRLDSVCDDFLLNFRENSASAYEFRDSFVMFVMHCFRHHYYPGHKKDIWKTIAAPDIAKREVEKNITKERVIDKVDADDICIHDMMLNIYEANRELFKHSGDSPDAHGIVYDMYYLLLCQLCCEKVDQINQLLGYSALQFVDPLDRRVDYADLPANRDIAAKISNAKSLLPFIFEYVRKGNLSTTTLTELRAKCFSMGTDNQGGTKCIWVLGNNSTAIKYLSSQGAVTNYQKFDTILRGVVSVYSLMMSLELHEKRLADNYDKSLFIASDVTRYIDYISALDHVDLIRKLQMEPVDYTRYTGDLYEFDKMVSEYAGSDMNNRIKENRYYAITHGFLRDPKLKQSSKPANKYEELRQLTQIFEVIPRNYTEMEEYYDQYEASSAMSSYHNEFPLSQLTTGFYSSMEYNFFIKNSPLVANTFLSSEDGSVPYKDTSWNVSTSKLSSVIATDTRGKSFIGCYLPLEGAFYVYVNEMTESMNLPNNLITLQEVFQFYRDSFVDGQPTINLNIVQLPVIKELLASNVGKKLEKSVGFNTMVGICNLNEESFLRSVDKMSNSKLCKSYLSKYYRQFGECSKLQSSVVDILNTIFAQCLYLCGPSSGLKASKAKDVEPAKKVLQGLVTGAFDTPSLDVALSWLTKSKYLSYVILTPSGTFEERDVDKSALLYCTSPADKSLSQEFVDAVKMGSTPAEKFILLCNYLSIRIESLRMLRDAYSLLISSFTEKAKTLTTELNERFKVMQTLTGHNNKWMPDLVSASTISGSELKAHAHSAFEMLDRHFHTLIVELSDYVGKCDNTIASIVEYDVKTVTNNKSKFEEWGTAFSISPVIPRGRFSNLDKLRDNNATDEFGFFLRNGKYFTGSVEGSTYYLHQTGYVLKEVGEEFIPVFRSVMSESEEFLYTRILESGMGNG